MSKKNEKEKKDEGFACSPGCPGGVNRRDFLKTAAAAGLAGAMAGPSHVLAGVEKKALSGEGDAGAFGDFRPDPITEEIREHAHRLGIDLVWDRETQCEFSQSGHGGVAGLCCFHCQMGPCTLGDATGNERGVCGATMDTIVARGLVARMVCGAASHAEHMRAAAKILKGVGLGNLPGYRIADPDKLDAVYKGLGCSGANKALAVAETSLADFSRNEGSPAWLEYKANPERKARWKKMGILPTGAGAEFSEASHRIHMGVDSDMENLAADALKLGLVDGYCGLHPASAIQDILFGVPKLVLGRANLTVLEKDQVNIAVHGHEPILSEKILEAARRVSSPPINVVGICCTGNELLMRKGVPLAGSMIQQELAIATGALEAMVVDVQCVMPNIQRVAGRFHTKIITTHPHARIEGATHMEFVPEKADEIAAGIVKTAVDNFANRKKDRMMIPKQAPARLMAGFSVEQIVAALAGLNPANPLKPLIDAIASNRVRGVAAIVGCVSPKGPYGYRHAILTQRLIKENVLVVGTGCWSHVAAQRGLMAPDPAYPGVGAGLKATLQAVAEANGLDAIPACWHMGACVDNARIEDVLNPLAASLKVKISDLPVAASAPELITEKAVSIGVWAVGLGVFTHIGEPPYVSGSDRMARLLTRDVENIVGGRFYVESDPEKAARAMLARIDEKRKALGLPV
ncbi:Carbon monoxide dehydrogenase 1 [Candidatus Desulfarcum epimagneticum]|uniref:Carbon monoxide dehydrogenase n=1 Tax=uncultured Desulfobacteraceae bacterium TaxID=218296 RepID=A0A484HNT9_9BACT|nr:Carbon monoxide dehydrogenase 1 [uncultured Desulfobacteraceae bacterium]